MDCRFSTSYRATQPALASGGDGYYSLRQPESLEFPLAERIAIASDHAAVALKATLTTWLREHGHHVIDLGPHSHESVDYPDYGYALGRAIEEGKADVGVALCGSGIGISIAANRNPAVRCALVNEPFSAKLARHHNDANVIAMGARLIGEDMAKTCVHAFLEATYEGGRHAVRVAKLSQPAKEPA
jgi:ribose 5-phosphate isomerase B